MRHFRREAVQWVNLASLARLTATEKSDRFTKPSLQVAELCEHIAASLERISDIIESVDGCVCGECPKDEPNTLQ